jgi:succinate dehydrogenase / fumarate reductase cytochrome b subunit
VSALAPSLVSATRLSWVSEFLSSSIGKKVVMAVTGAALFGFVLAHMAGNLLAYKGPEALNAYAEGLRRFPALLWGARLGLLAAAALHVWAATSLTLRNWAARPVAYRRRRSLASTYASRTMVWSGPILLLFVVYHLLHFTTGTVHHDFVPGDVYRNFVTGFRVPWVSGFYVAAMLALGLHLYHGAWSMLQTLGLSHPRYNAWRDGLCALVTALIVAVNISFPVAVLLGIIR